MIDEQTFVEGINMSPKVIGNLLKVIGKASVAVKAKVSNALGIKTTAFDSAWIAKVSAHMDKHPLSYATVMGAISSYAPDVLSDLFDGISSDEVKALTKLLPQSVVPHQFNTGADGSEDKVWGMSENEFEKHIAVTAQAKKVVDEAAFMLAMQPLEVIQLASLLRAIEPQFSKLYEK